MHAQYCRCHVDIRGPNWTKVIGPVVNLPMAVIGNYRGVNHDGQDEDIP